MAGTLTGYDAGIYTGPVSLTAATMFFSEVLILKLLLW